MSDKIKPHHLERKAILYIRQSSAYQVSHNLESQKLQYAMQERLQQLGWREIEVVRERGHAQKIVLSGKAAEYARRKRIAAFHLSITHTEASAMAHVIAEG